MIFLRNFNTDSASGFCAVSLSCENEKYLRPTLVLGQEQELSGFKRLFLYMRALAAPSAPRLQVQVKLRRNAATTHQLAPGSGGASSSSSPPPPPPPSPWLVAGGAAGAPSDRSVVAEASPAMSSPAMVAPSAPSADCCASFADSFHATSRPGCKGKQLRGSSEGGGDGWVQGRQ